jgi:hypothetical protein
MARVLHHVCWWLVALLGLIVPHTRANVTNYEDEGAALAACEAALSTAVPKFAPLPFTQTTVETRRFRSCTPANAQGQDNVPPFTMYICQVEWIRSDTGQLLARDRCDPPDYALATGARSEFRFTGTCASRPQTTFAWEGRQYTGTCSNGCQYNFPSPVCAWNRYGPVDAPVWRYQCSATAITTGQTCTGDGYGAGTDPPPRQPDPQDPDPEEPDPEEPDPEEPDPEEPDPEEPDPEEPDPNEPGDGEQLGPKLDKIEQAVLGLGPKIDGVRAAVEGARSDANADADRMVSALDSIRGAIVAQGPNGTGTGGGEGEPEDLSPLTPGPDGGEHPSVDSIVERGDADSLIAQLDVDGWALTRSCPAYSWPLSFDLGWGSVNIADAVDMVCGAMAILGFVIGLAGLIQASFILSRVGGAA